MNYAGVAIFILAVLLRPGWAQYVGSNPSQTGFIQHRTTPLSTGLTYCSVPPQPSNGRWKLHRSLCDNGLDCNIPQGIALKSGSRLIYSCDSGFRANRNTDVYCIANGRWSPIPRCIEIKCNGLTSASTKARCTRLGDQQRCDIPVRTKTRAEVNCRPGYKKDITYLVTQRESVTCNDDGEWQPHPIRCVPDCGITTPFETGANAPEIADLPWRATLYIRRSFSDENSIESILCGVTIIQSNLMLTAAHCVYDKKTGSTVDAGKLFVVTGNRNRAYDYLPANPGFVQKSEVKNVLYLPEKYKLRKEFWSLDIALIELQKPFVLSRNLLPACLHLEGLISEQDFVLGAYGSIAGFGVSARNNFSDFVQTAREPYIHLSQCNATLGAIGHANVINFDQFCTGFPNGPTFNEYGGGGGLVFNKDNRWYIVGVFSAYIASNDSKPTNQKRSRSVFTSVSSYMPWIIDVIFHLERNESAIEEPNQGRTPNVLSTNISVFSNVGNISCKVPPQPENGEWKFRGYLCGNNTDCQISQNTVLRPGSQLVYTCLSGYRVSGSTVVYCGENGTWSDIPVCIEVKCKPLSSESIMASCSRAGKSVNCDFPVPRTTRAEISCRMGYTKETIFTATRKEIVFCGEDGKWTPDPIRCILVCGVRITHQTPLAVGGAPAYLGEFPWHASLYLQTQTGNGNKKEYRCGSTIIHPNFLLTAAHCVYNDSTSTTLDPAQFFVMTGNIFRDYDHPVHENIVVRKAAVKYVFTHFYYYGLRGKYDSDIALLELQQPFNFSGIILPACLDFEGYSTQILEPGVYGRVAAFGKNDIADDATLQTIKLPYISYAKCRASTHGRESQYLISNDKFCAGYTNGTTLGEGDSGGGLMFPRNDLWYVLGIVSVGLGLDIENGQRSSYTLYTKVSTYLEWIQEVISKPEQYKSYHEAPTTTPGPHFRKA